MAVSFKKERVAGSPKVSLLHLDMIRPISNPHGVGFCSNEKQNYTGYTESQAKHLWNYHVNTSKWAWPEPVDIQQYNYVIDGFSPNLNKKLHVGHLRNLVLAKSLKMMLPGAKMVSLLGASQGYYQYAVDGLESWFKFIDYQPKFYYDVLMPQDDHIVPRHKDNDETSKNFGCEVWDGPKGPVIVTRSNGKSTYKFHDIAFANTVKPTHYLTGVEQKEHFEELGLADKHLPFGLVLGSDGKKMKSRTGDSPDAEEILDEIQGNLKETPDPKKLAWNVIAWNFLGSARLSNIKYDPVQWTNPDHPGMYISYTFARISSAFGGLREGINIWHTEYLEKHSNYFNFTQKDVELMGFACYYDYYFKRVGDKMDPTEMAHFAKDLARQLNLAYKSEKINGGREAFRHAVGFAAITLERAMLCLGMFPLSKV